MPKLLDCHSFLRLASIPYPTTLELETLSIFSKSPSARTRILHLGARFRYHECCMSLQPIDLRPAVRLRPRPPSDLQGQRQRQQHYQHYLELPTGRRLGKSSTSISPWSLPLSSSNAPLSLSHGPVAVKIPVVSVIPRHERFLLRLTDENADCAESPPRLFIV